MAEDNPNLGTIVRAFQLLVSSSNTRACLGNRLVSLSHLIQMENEAPINGTIGQIQCDVYHTTARPISV